MARVYPIFPAFTAGELTPLLHSRVEFNKYQLGAKQLTNMIVRPHGPAQRRPGTRYVVPAKSATGAARLLPFEFSTEQAYIIELGVGYFRFYYNGGQITLGGSPVELSHPYTATELEDVDYIQSADTLFLAHPNHAVRTLTRTSHTAWVLTEANFVPPPTYEDGHNLSATLTPAATSGNGVTFTAGANVFLASDVGRAMNILQGTGRKRAVIRTIVGAAPDDQVTADILDALDNVTVVASANWFLERSPATTCDPSPDTLVGQQFAALTLTLGAGGWRSGDVGRYVRLSGGMVKITSVASSAAADGVVLFPLSASSAVVAGAWSLESSEFSAARGYPSALTFFEQRLIAGGSPARPATWWATTTGDYYNFSLSADDDGGMAFTIASNEVNAIRWFVPTRNLLIGTTGAEYKVIGGADSPLTPTNIDVKPETVYGSILKPVRMGNVLLFTSRSSRDLFEMAYEYTTDTYAANDRLILGEHLARDRQLVSLAAQRAIHPLVWAVRTDGYLLTMTYERAHDVYAWTKHVTGAAQNGTDGVFVSVAVIPHPAGGRDQVWCLTERRIQGQPVRYIEYFDDLGDTGTYYAAQGGLMVDSGLSTKFASPQGGVGGLSHLEGQTVAILGDGAVYPSQVVSGGTVMLDPPASVIEVGIPFTSTLETMRPEIAIGGTGQGRVKGWASISVRLMDSLGCTVNGESVPFRSAGDDMDEPPPLFSGDVEVLASGYDTAATILVTQAQPLPLTVTGVFGTATLGD